MQVTDFPALFQSADAAAMRTQRNLLATYVVYLGLLLGGALVPLMVTGRWGHGTSFVLLLASLVVYALRQWCGWHAKWYQARALAESVKTMTWRFVMRAEPFAAESDRTNADVFRKRLTELLKQNQSIGSHLNLPSDDSAQITSGMRDRLKWTFEEAKDGYRRERIVDQLNWYTSKSQRNKAAASSSLAAILGLYGVAVIFQALLTISPELERVPVAFTAVIAGGLVGWVEIRRYSELASAYALTAQEVGIINSRAEDIVTVGELAAFVSDAENAFSREHTQWEARRNH